MPENKRAAGGLASGEPEAPETLTPGGGLLEIGHPPMETIHGAPSHTLKTAEVELAVTQTAGHLAPVTFHLPGLKASPYSLSPWTPTQIHQSLPNLLT